jgi:glycosyltransferase involved in cell wall biosynthesis
MPEFLSVVLPIYNQADHIQAVVDEYEQALARLPHPHELLLVVNGSRDDSLAICEELASRYASVRTFSSAQAGWGRAVKLGLQEARGTLLCYTNTARTTAADLVLLLLYAVANPGVVVKANRKIRDNWIRRLGSLLYNLECRALFDLSYWDINGTPKVFPRACARLLRLISDDDLIDAEFSIVCREENYRVLEVPIISRGRHGARSTTGLRTAYRLYTSVFRLKQRMRAGTAA